MRHQKTKCSIKERFVLGGVCRQKSIVVELIFSNSTLSNKSNYTVGKEN
jgi:hypothetical protein